MLGRQNREFPLHKTEPAGFADKATDLEALRTAVVDAAGVGYGLWFSYLFALLYFAIAAGAVTHRDLLLENPVKLPFLNVELPLKAFFILGPLVFLVVHAYVLLHFLLLSGKVGGFHAELQKQVPGDEKRAQLRRQLPSNIFVQFLGGPREVREGIVGFLLKSVAWISLVAGPIALLVLFQLQFLPYHNAWITWWQRIAVFVDLILLWLLWPPIARGETALLAWNDLRRARMAAWLPVSLLPLLLVFTVATFPGEWFEQELYRIGLVDLTTGEIKTYWWGWPHKLLVAGEIDYVTGKPRSLWSNVLVVPSFDFGNRLKVDADNRVSISSEAVTLRGRNLEGAVLAGAHLRKADFTGAYLAGADFFRADLREAKFGCDDVGDQEKCAQLPGAGFQAAQLQGASFRAAQLQGSSLRGAQLQGASLDRAQLQGASLDRARLQGASLDNAQLQGVSLNGTQLQGAALRGVYVWRAKPPAAEDDVRGAFIERVEPKAKYRGYDCPTEESSLRSTRTFGLGELECSWSRSAYAALTSLLEQHIPEGYSRYLALRQIELLREPGLVDPEVEMAWRRLEDQSRSSSDHLTETLRQIGCAAAGAPYVIGGLISQLSYRFDDPIQASRLAAAFLDPGCAGTLGLSEENRARLQEIIEWVKPSSSSVWPKR
jgi:hypothetical protein